MEFTVAVNISLDEQFFEVSALPTIYVKSALTKNSFYKVFQF